MTIPEMALCCEVPGPMGEEGRKAPRGMPNMGPEENARAIAEWRSMTPLQRVEKLMRDRT